MSLPLTSSLYIFTTNIFNDSSDSLSKQNISNLSLTPSYLFQNVRSNCGDLKLTSNPRPWGSTRRQLMSPGENPKIPRMNFREKSKRDSSISRPSFCRRLNRTQKCRGTPALAAAILQHSVKRRKKKEIEHKKQFSFTKQPKSISWMQVPRRAQPSPPAPATNPSPPNTNLKEIKKEQRQYDTIISQLINQLVLTSNTHTSLATILPLRKDKPE